MGSGKTTVGRLLARHLGWHFGDVDRDVEQLSGLSIAEMFERLGEPAFREMESQALARILGEVTEQDRSMVVALGGGTIVQPQNLAMLRQSGGIIIWLDCPLEELLSRCARMTDRPLFRDEASFRQLFEQRLPFYRLAHCRVDGSGVPRQVVKRILILEILDRVRA